MKAEIEENYRYIECGKSGRGGLIDVWVPWRVIWKCFALLVPEIYNVIRKILRQFNVKLSRFWFESIALYTYSMTRPLYQNQPKIIHINWFTSKNHLETKSNCLSLKSLENRKSEFINITQYECNEQHV